MSTGWTAPGSTEGTAGHQPGPAGGTGGPAPHGNGAPAPQPVGGPASGPQRGLVQQVPLFPLRPLNVGEVLGAAVRIYRVRPKPVLGLAAAVYGIAFVLITLATGAGMIPLVGQMQATLEDPTGEAAEGLETVGGTTSQILATVSSTVVTMIITLVASALVTVVLTRITVGEATGDSVPDGRLWSLLRGQALPAVAVSLLMGVLGSVAFLLPLAVGALPLLVTQEAGWLTIIALLLGLLAGVLAALWVFARTALSLPALAIEGTGVLGSLHRSFQMTAGRKLWRVLGLMLLLVLIFYFAQQIVAGVFVFIAFILYVAILLASSLEAFVLAMGVMTVIMMLGTYIATFLLAPFLCAGYAAIYADNRMRHEAWDVELNRQARAGREPTAPGAPS